MHESILGKLSTIAQARDAEKVAQGRVRDEEDNWIPPGWVRKDAA